ncbi:PREDICTED: formin-like protein 11 [Nicotiana attenuata]|uniref:Formin-like protein n=1 Tax=Nicotiana attenuata TaxID=49451 RepID=A0A1J6J2G9_NICAT|nr:PREDICTED: formin-like protein 11 [Nicotiana attenuata]OIT04095.1 formin-like protein 11 [Nicotiana attenuata]
MGHYHGSRILLHFLFIITFILVSFCCTHILFGDVSLNATKYLTSIHGFKKLHYLHKNGDGKESESGKISGEKQVFIVEKFRTLLGLRNFNSRNGDFAYISTSPSPSPSPSIAPEAPAPSPAPRIHRHSHRHSHHNPFIPAGLGIKERRRKNNTSRVLAVVLVSAGISTALCAIALFFGCKKFRKQRKKTTRSVSLFSSEAGSVCRSRYASSQNSVKKVSSDPGPDLFYLDSLEVALESSEPICLKQNSVTEKIYSSENIANSTLSEKAEPEQEISVSKPDGDNKCLSVGEIVCIYESADSVKCEIDDCNSSNGDKIVPEEAHSSDDELFHSLCNSRSSSTRLSNVSASSLIETSEFMPQDESKVSHCSTSSSAHLSTPPLPPPPPPLPSFPPQSPCRSTASSVKMKAKVLSHAPLHIESSTRNSDSSSGSNQSPENDLSQSPPNQANPAGAIPPPPRPPPFATGSSINISKGPPPPPSLPFQHLAVGKDGSPLPKLKPLHWDKVRAASDRKTVWDKLRPSSFEFDEEMIESLFGYNLHNSMKTDEGKSKTPSPSKHVLDPKRLQNISILSKALGVTVEQVCEALIKGNGLHLPQLEALAKMVPTKEEEDKLSSYKGDINELGSAEKFVMAMLKIPFAFLRIEAMLYRETFDDDVHLLKKSFSMLEEACKELRSSRLFLKLLEAVLKTGNRMNIGTIRGGARAFKLDALLKLSDVKGTDGKTTLLHFVVQEIIRSEGLKVSQSIMGKIDQKRKNKTVQDREEDYKRMGLDLVSGLGTELCNVKKTATMDLDVIASSVSNLSEGMNKIKALVTNDLPAVEKNGGNFVHSMTAFLNYAERKLRELQEDENRVLLRVREVTEYFHGNVSKEESNPLRIFVIVRDFLGVLDHVCKELRSSKTPNSPNPLAPFR